MCRDSEAMGRIRYVARMRPVGGRAVSMPPCVFVRRHGPSQGRMTDFPRKTQVIFESSF